MTIMHRLLKTNKQTNRLRSPSTICSPCLSGKWNLNYWFALEVCNPSIAKSYVFHGMGTADSKSFCS